MKLKDKLAIIRGRHRNKLGHSPSFFQGAKLTLAGEEEIRFKRL
jgi:hypothetical protein